MIYSFLIYLIIQCRLKAYGSGEQMYLDGGNIVSASNFGSVDGDTAMIFTISYNDV